MQTLSVFRKPETTRKMKLLLATLVLGLIACVAAESFASQPSHVNCMIKHFKAKGLMRADFAELGDGSVVEGCEKHIEEYPSYMENYFKTKAGPDAGGCFYEKATAMNFVDMAMLDEFHRATAKELAWTPEEVETLQNGFENHFSEVMEPCSYPPLPEAFFTAKKEEHESFKGDKDANQYCENKYVVDNHLIDTEVFKVIVNPKELDTTTIDCEKIIADLKFHLGYRNYGESATGRKACKTNDARNYNAMFHADIARMVSATFDRTDEQTAFFRDNFEKEDRVLSKFGVTCDYFTHFFD